MVSNVTAKLELSATMKVKDIHDNFRVSLVKPYTKDSFETYPEKLQHVRFADGYEQYEVEMIFNHRKRYGKLQHLIQWKNFPVDENTRENEKNFENAQNALPAYRASRRCFT